MLMTNVALEEKPAKVKDGGPKKKVASEGEEAEVGADVVADESEAEVSEAKGAGPSQMMNLTKMRMVRKLCPTQPRSPT